MDADGSSSTWSPPWLPAVYRPLVVICVGVWGWALNLFLLHRHHIDPAALLQIHPVDKHIPLHQPVFILAGMLSFNALVNLSWYMRIVTPESPSLWLPAIAYLSSLLLLFWPRKQLLFKERARFLRVLRRACSMNLVSPVYFADIILADILTSFSNVLGDLFVAIWILVTGDDRNYSDALPMKINSLAWHPDLFLPLPYLIRLRQCLSEYLESRGQQSRHLFNALKYASAFPVIILSAVQRRATSYVAETGSVPKNWWLDEVNIFRLWMVCVFINSMYSFWWDISMDWSFMHFTYDTGITKHVNAKPQTTPILRFRRHLHFSSAFPYFTAMIIDFLLRTTWSLKLSSHLYLKQLEGSLVFIELLEVLRRWVWVIFRMESEWVKRTHGMLPMTNNNNSNPNHNNNDILRMERLEYPPAKLAPIREEDDPIQSSTHSS
ncbi:EXS family-domain-containing protein [Radiomyces spectabilis]|uniref:EXS family-domain-containing protein n=1 Tax=Radiomyces spectabilis TaxID=64574 RepID=UPI00221EBAC5|nr:EXS family-domain-containing protein [Radiomyces spectabilis]KAI8391594.1 EXS family-domain-containing protein [Radiomyces spectabilis]